MATPGYSHRHGLRIDVTIARNDARLTKIYNGKFLACARVRAGNFSRRENTIKCKGGNAPRRAAAEAIKALAATFVKRSSSFKGVRRRSRARRRS